MKITLDPDLASEAKALNALACNGPIEELTPADSVLLAMARTKSPSSR